MGIAAAPEAGGAGAGVAGVAVAGALAAPGTSAAAPEAAGADAPAAGRSSTLPPSVPAGRAFDRYANANVQTKNSVAQAAVERDRKFAEPVAPNRLPDAPRPE